jgi:hypothetical protein
MKIRVNDIDVNYVLEGPSGGPTVTMSHSLATDLSMWDAQAIACGDTTRGVMAARTPRPGPIR